MLQDLTNITSISGTLAIRDASGESARDVQDFLDDGGDTTLDTNACVRTLGAGRGMKNCRLQST